MQGPDEGSSEGSGSDAGDYDTCTSQQTDTPYYDTDSLQHDDTQRHSEDRDEVTISGHTSCTGNDTCTLL